MAEFKDSTSALIGDVDCTVEEDICSKNGVEGYPTIKHGTVGALEDYQGGREYDDLLAFAKENLGPTCGPQNLDLCSSEQKKEITETQALTDDQLMAKLKEKEDALAAEEKTFTDAVEKLQTQYEEMTKAKEAKMAEIKGSGMSTLLAVCKDRPSCTPPAPPPAPEGEGAGDEEMGGGDEEMGGGDEEEMPYPEDGEAGDDAEGDEAPAEPTEDATEL